MAKSKSPRRRPPASERKTARQHERDINGQGELSELAFAHKAASLGFGVAKPCSPREAFDFILISRDPPSEVKLWRVQVKSTTRLSKGVYHVDAIHRVGGQKTCYLPSEIDFLVVHIVPDDSYFVFPVHAITGRPNLYLPPKNSGRARALEGYREAWHLLRPRR